MAGHIRSETVKQTAAGLVLLALSLAASAGAQTAQTPPATIASGRPEFYVPWVPNAPGLTARPAPKRGTGLPRYPAESIKAKEAGRTIVEVCITVEGRLTDLKLVTSSGFVRLDQALLEWAPSAAYTPAVYNGQPFAVCGYQIIYEWRLTGQ